MRQVTTDREDVRQVREAAEEVEQALKAASLGFKGLTLSHTFSGAGSVTIDHKLNRQPVGWTITDLSSAVTVHRTAWSTTTIILTASGACTVQVLVW